MPPAYLLAKDFDTRPKLIDLKIDIKHDKNSHYRRHGIDPATRI